MNNPCEEQRVLMTGLGFALADDMPPGLNEALWGCGDFQLSLPERQRPTAAEIVARLILQAREQGRREAQKAMRHALGFDLAPGGLVRRV